MTHVHRPPRRDHRERLWDVVILTIAGLALVLLYVVVTRHGADRGRPAGAVHTTPAAPARADLLVTPSPWPSAASRCCATRTALPGGGR